MHTHKERQRIRLTNQEEEKETKKDKTVFENNKTTQEGSTDLWLIAGVSPSSVTDHEWSLEKWFLYWPDEISFWKFDNFLLPLVFLNWFGESFVANRNFCTNIFSNIFFDNSATVFCSYGFVLYNYSISTLKRFFCVTNFTNKYKMNCWFSPWISPFSCWAG